MNDLQWRILESLQRYEKTTNIKERATVSSRCGSGVWVFLESWGRKQSPQGLPSTYHPSHLASSSPLLCKSIAATLVLAYHWPIQISRIPSFFLFQTHCFSFSPGQRVSFPYHFPRAVPSTWNVHCSVLGLVNRIHFSDHSVEFLISLTKAGPSFKLSSSTKFSTLETFIVVALSHFDELLNVCLPYIP